MLLRMSVQKLSFAWPKYLSLWFFLTVAPISLFFFWRSLICCSKFKEFLFIWAVCGDAPSGFRKGRSLCRSPCLCPWLWGLPRVLGSSDRVDVHSGPAHDHRAGPPCGAAGLRAISLAPGQRLLRRVAVPPLLVVEPEELLFPTSDSAHLRHGPRAHVRTVTPLRALTLLGDGLRWAWLSCVAG